MKRKWEENKKMKSIWIDENDYEMFRLVALVDDDKRSTSIIIKDLITNYTISNKYKLSEKLKKNNNK